MKSKIPGVIKPFCDEARKLKRRAAGHAYRVRDMICYAFDVPGSTHPLESYRAHPSRMISADECDASIALASGGAHRPT